MNFWWLGVLLAVVASILSNAGLTVQKYTHLQNAQLVKDRYLAVSAVSKSGEPSETRSSISQDPDDEMSETKFSFPNDPDCSAPLFEPVSLVRRDSKGNLNAAAAGKEPTKQTNQGEENSNGNEVSRHSPKLLHPDKFALANDSTASVSHTSSEGGSNSPASASASVSVSASPDAHLSINYTKQPLWQFGMALVVAGSFFDFAALAFTDQSIVAPLGSLTLVCNAIFAPIFLKERVTRRVVFCTLTIVSGSALAVTFASHDDKVPKVSEMFQLFLNYRFVVYISVVAGSIAALRMLCWKYGEMRRRGSSEYMKYIALHRFCYAASSGIAGSVSVLLAKCTAQLLLSTIAGDGIMFVYPGTYAILVGLACAVFYQTRWLNSGLRLFPALYIVPIFQAFWILVSVISGMVFFQEYEGLYQDTINMIMFPIGLLMTLGGVYLLTQGAKANSDMEEFSRALAQEQSRIGEEEEEEEDEDTCIGDDCADFDLESGGSGLAYTSSDSLNEPLLKSSEVPEFRPRVAFSDLESIVEVESNCGSMSAGSLAAQTLPQPPALKEADWAERQVDDELEEANQSQRKDSKSPSVSPAQPYTSPPAARSRSAASSPSPQPDSLAPAAQSRSSMASQRTSPASQNSRLDKPQSKSTHVSPQFRPVRFAEGTKMTEKDKEKRKKRRSTAGNPRNSSATSNAEALESFYVLTPLTLPLGLIPSDFVGLDLDGPDPALPPSAAPRTRAESSIDPALLRRMRHSTSPQPSAAPSGLGKRSLSQNNLSSISAEPSINSSANQPGSVARP